MFIRPFEAMLLVELLTKRVCELAPSISVVIRSVRRSQRIPKLDRINARLHGGYLVMQDVGISSRITGRPQHRHGRTGSTCASVRGILIRTMSVNQYSEVVAMRFHCRYQGDVYC